MTFLPLIFYSAQPNPAQQPKLNNYACACVCEWAKNSSQFKNPPQLAIWRQLRFDKRLDKRIARLVGWLVGFEVGEFDASFRHKVTLPRTTPFHHHHHHHHHSTTRLVVVLFFIRFFFVVFLFWSKLASYYPRPPPFLLIVCVCVFFLNYLN